MNISGNEVSGISDPSTMFLIVGGLILLGILVAGAYSLYSLIK